MPTASSVTDADMILIVQAKRLKRALPSTMKGEKGDKGDRVLMRLSETAVQWQHEGDDSWKDLITIAEIQAPAKAATDAANAAATKANTAAANADTATGKANTATTNANSAATSANNAAQSANAAAASANAAADRVDESILDVTTEKELAIAAAKNANDSATGAQQSTVRANAAAEKSEEVISRAEQAVTDANNATDSATEKIGEMNTGLARLEELEGTLTEEKRQQPTAMEVTYPKLITFGSDEAHFIKVTLSPAGTGSNVLFLSDNQSVKVAPNGFIQVVRSGKSFVHVIPTENTSIYQTVMIEVLGETLRLVTATSMRLGSSGEMRLL